MNKKFLLDLDVRINNIKAGLIPYSFLTALLVVGSLMFLNLTGNSLIGLWHQLYPSPALLILLAFLQELFFRSILMAGLKSKFKNVFIVVFLDAFIFAIAHVIFPFSELIVPGAFLVGIGFAVVYFYYPNLILATASHSILNLIVIPICSFKIINC